MLLSFFLSVFQLFVKLFAFFVNHNCHLRVLTLELDQVVEAQLQRCRPLETYDCKLADHQRSVLLVALQVVVFIVVQKVGVVFKANHASLFNLKVDRIFGQRQNVPVLVGINKENALYLFIFLKEIVMLKRQPRNQTVADPRQESL